MSFSIDLSEALNAPEKDEIWPEILNTLAGPAILQLATKVTDGTGSTVTDAILESTWSKRILPRDGILGDGKKRAIICRDPGSPIPRCLRESRAVTVPSRLVISEMLESLASDLGATMAGRGAGFFGSVTEKELSGFLFEAFRNAIEHRGEPPEDGVWGIIIEKLFIGRSEEISTRHQIPPLVRSFVEDAWERSATGKGLFLLSATVCDFGLGIQHSLPKLNDEEDGWNRFIRAFGNGVSRKPQSGTPGWGQGLPNILDTLEHLDGLLFVRSSEEVALVDGGSKSPDWRRLSDSFPSPPEVSGTSHSALWAVTAENPDQKTFGF